MSDGAVWLREQLLEIASSRCPGRRPVVVREWADPVRLQDPAPVGHRFLVMVAVAEDLLVAPPPGLDDVVDAFTAAGWTAHQWAGDGPWESWATARRADFEVRAYQGDGPGIFTLTGWTPVVFAGRELRQPRATLSTAGGEFCRECYGWGACLDCDGTGVSHEGGYKFASYGRCWCWAGRGGPGVCTECAGTGALERARTSDADAFRQPPVENGHVSTTDALTDVVHRSCECGEFRCLWRNSLVAGDSHLISRFTGSCQGCGTERAYAFALPYRKLPGPPPAPSPPQCPGCGASPVPLAGGLHFPGSAMMRAQDRGLVAALRSGSAVSADDPNWRCLSCGHDWRDADQRLHARVLRGILADVPAS